MDKNFIEDLRKENIILDEEMVARFDSFFKYLVSENEKMNLTRMTDEKEVYYFHFFDSLMCLKAIDENRRDISLLDIGAGPGFPGCPIKIVRNDINLSVVEATNKKAEFIKRNLNNMGLEANVFHSRAEDFDGLSKYDYVTTRAVSTIKEQLPYTIPFLKIGGRLISMKGQNRANDEIEESRELLKKIGARVRNIINYSVLDREYCLVVIEKIKETPSCYPIKINKSKKK